MNCKERMNKRLRLLGICEPIKNKPTKIKKNIGYSLIGIGVLTFPLPSGSPIIITLGLKMSDIDKKDIKRGINYNKIMFKSGGFKRYITNKMLLLKNNN